jgi:hypothetical protein
MRKTMRETQEAKREEALAKMELDVAEGKLVVRQMTDAERVRYTRSATAPLRSARRRY